MEEQVEEKGAEPAIAEISARMNIEARELQKSTEAIMGLLAELGRIGFGNSWEDSLAKLQELKTKQETWEAIEPELPAYVKLVIAREEERYLSGRLRMDRDLSSDQVRKILERIQRLKLEIRNLEVQSLIK